MKFKDQVIWITGASSGIGEALAMSFAKEGARLILSARREDELKRVAKNTGLPDPDIMLLAFDLNDTSKATALAAQVMNKFGRIDVLVNNGGFSQRAESSQTSEIMARELMEVNYFSAVNLTQAVLPYMKRQKGGHLVVISSIAGKFGFYLRSSYSAAKHALHGYFESLRLETEGMGIKTMLVCPGKIKTNISLNASTGDGNKHLRMDPSHEKAMSAEQCALKILDGIQRNKSEILIGGKEIWMVYFKRFLPALFERLVRKQSPY